jgi:hypothetical protein
MTRDEQRQITDFIVQVANPGPDSKPMDPEADAIIRALFVRNPDAAYRMTGLALTQAQALAKAEAMLAALQQPQGQPGFFARLFGARSAPGSAYQPPGLPARPGLPGIMSNLAGAAGGVMLGEALLNMFDAPRMDAMPDQSWNGAGGFDLAPSDNGANWGNSDDQFI